MGVELGAGWGATCKASVRGALDAPAPADHFPLAELTINATYNHNLDTDTQTGGTVGVAIGPAQVNVNRSQDRHVTDGGNLVLTARYERREEVPVVTETKAPDA
jgi:hypothetical protein